MSRIGKKAITIPAGVDVTIDGNTVTVKGAKGTLSNTFKPNITIEKDGAEIKLSRPDDQKENRALHGLTRTLIANIEGGLVFSREGDCIWQCANCGHIVVGKKAPDVCPVCDHPQSYFQIKAENY